MEQAFRGYRRFVLPQQRQAAGEVIDLLPLPAEGYAYVAQCRLRGMAHPLNILLIGSALLGEVGEVHGGEPDRLRLPAQGPQLLLVGGENGEGEGDDPPVYTALLVADIGACPV